MKGDAVNGERINGDQRSVRVKLCLCLLTLAVIFAGCHSAAKLPDVSSKAYADFVSHFYVGLAALQVGDDVRAESSLAQATQLAPGEPAAWTNWGILALRERNFDAAAQRFDHALSLDPGDDRLNYLMNTMPKNVGGILGSL